MKRLAKKLCCLHLAALLMGMPLARDAVFAHSGDDLLAGLRGGKSVHSPSLDPFDLPALQRVVEAARFQQLDTADLGRAADDLREVVLAVPPGPLPASTREDVLVKVESYLDALRRAAAMIVQATGGSVLPSSVEQDIRLVEVAALEILARVNTGEGLRGAFGADECAVIVASRRNGGVVDGLLKLGPFLIAGTLALWAGLITLVNRQEALDRFDGGQEWVAQVERERLLARTRAAEAAFRADTERLKEEIRARGRIPYDEQEKRTPRPESPVAESFEEIIEVDLGEGKPE